MNFYVIKTRRPPIRLYDKMMVMSLRRYIEDYEIETLIDETGREKKILKYKGPLFNISIPGMEFKIFKRWSYILLGALILFHISSGFIANPGMYQFFVAVPYAVVFIPLTLLGFGIVGLPNNLEKIQRDIMEHSFRRIKTSSIVLLVIFALITFGELVFMILNPSLPHLKNEILFIMPELLASTSVIAIFLLYRKVKIEQIK